MRMDLSLCSGFEFHFYSISLELVLIFRVLITPASLLIDYFGRCVRFASALLVSKLLFLRSGIGYCNIEFGMKTCLTIEFSIKGHRFRANLQSVLNLNSARPRIEITI